MANRSKAHWQTATEFIAAVLADGEQIHWMRAGNGSGQLWEHGFRRRDGKIESKVFVSGSFQDWSPYKTTEDAVRRVAQSLALADDFMYVRTDVKGN